MTKEKANPPVQQWIDSGIWCKVNGEEIHVNIRYRLSGNCITDYSYGPKEIKGMENVLPYDPELDDPGYNQLGAFFTPRLHVKDIAEPSEQHDSMELRNACSIETVQEEFELFRHDWAIGYEYIGTGKTISLSFSAMTFETLKDLGIMIEYLNNPRKLV